MLPARYTQRDRKVFHKFCFTSIIPCLHFACWLPICSYFGAFFSSLPFMCLGFISCVRGIRLIFMLILICFCCVYAYHRATMFFVFFILLLLAAVAVYICLCPFRCTENWIVIVEWRKHRPNATLSAFDISFRGEQTKKKIVLVVLILLFFFHFFCRVSDQSIIYEMSSFFSLFRKERNKIIFIFFCARDHIRSCVCFAISRNRIVHEKSNKIKEYFHLLKWIKLHESCERNIKKFMTWNPRAGRAKLL